MENKIPGQALAVSDSAQVSTPEKSNAPSETVPGTPETSEEATMAEFRRKHPDLVAGPANILQRKMRLERGHKYFDSGDYNMAKAKSAKEGVALGPKLIEELDTVGEDHPTPDSIPHKKYPPVSGVSKLAQV